MGSETGIWADKHAAPIALGELDLSLVEDRLSDFLDRYGVATVIGRELAAVVGEGAGKERLARLMAACGFADQPEAFIRTVLDQLSLASPASVATVRFGDITLPRELLLVFLEEMMPGSGFVSIRNLEHYEALCNLKVPADERDAVERVIHEYPVRLSHHILRLVRLSEGTGYQYLPFADELSAEGQVHTWIGQFHQGVLEQMYDNRVIFVLHMSCPVYCRFCFRKHKETREQAPPTVEDVDKALAYLAGNDHVREVVLTGGEPLMNRKTVEQAMINLRRPRLSRGLLARWILLVVVVGCENGSGATDDRGTRHRGHSTAASATTAVRAKDTRTGAIPHLSNDQRCVGGKKLVAIGSDQERLTICWHDNAVSRIDRDRPANGAEADLAGYRHITNNVCQLGDRPGLRGVDLDGADASSSICIGKSALSRPRRRRHDPDTDNRCCSEDATHGKYPSVYPC